MSSFLWCLLCGTVFGYNIYLYFWPGKERQDCSEEEETYDILKDPCTKVLNREELDEYIKVATLQGYQKSEQDIFYAVNRGKLYLCRSGNTVEEWVEIGEI